MQQNEILDKKYTIFPLCLIIILGLGIRFYNFPLDVPIVNDGFFSFVYASKMVIDGWLPVGYTTTNTGWSYFLALVFSIFNNTEPFQLMTVQRISTIVISSLTVIPVYFLLRKFVGTRLSLFGGLLFAVEPRLLLISLDGINFSLFVFLFVTSITLFLKRTNKSLMLSFVCIALMSLIRYEGILLLIPFTVMFLVFNKTNKKYLKLFGLVSLFIIILLPIMLIRIDATSELCYNSLFESELCGTDGIIINFIQRTESISDKIIGNPDMDDPIYNKSEPMFGHFLFLSFSNLFKFLAIICLPYFFIFIGLSVFRFKKRNLKLKSDYVFIIFSTCVMIIPAIYAYGRGFEDYRYVLIAIPLLTIFSAKIMESFPKMEKNRNIFFVLIFFIILLSIVFIQNEKSDDDLHREAFYVSKKVYQLTDTINTYQYSGYLKTAEIIEEWPELPKSDPLRLGKLEMSTTKIPTKGYETIHEFLQDEENEKLQYIVLDKRNEFFNDLRENPSNYNYLEIIFDSKDLDFENEFKIYRINDRK